VDAVDAVAELDVAELDVAKLDVAELDVPELDVAELAVAELVASVCLRIRSRIFMSLFAAAVAVAVVFVDGMSRWEFLRKPAAAGCGWRREDVDLCFPASRSSILEVCTGVSV
jgi:hypothetical protein